MTAAPRIRRTVQGVLSNAAGGPNGVGLLGRKWTVGPFLMRFPVGHHLERAAGSRSAMNPFWTLVLAARAASCCLACSSSVTASVPISVLSPMPRPLAVDRLGLTNNPRIKHCRASHLAACGYTVLPKIGPVIALRTDYQSPNWLSGAEDELSQPRFR